MCGTKLAHGAVRCVCYDTCSAQRAYGQGVLRAKCDTELAHGAVLRVCYAMCGTELAYGAGHAALFGV
eukprot:1682424-Rhodomonas_salina.1